MTDRSRRFLVLPVLCLTAALGMGSGATPPKPAIVALEADAQDREAFSFRLNTPAPKIESRADGRVSVALEGFATHEERPGAPDLPMKVVWVAIPPGAEPSLEVRVLQEELLPEMRPRAAGRFRPGAARPLLDASGLEAEAPEDPEVYSSDRSYPASVAWLGPVGTFREQRFVPVHLAPVRYDPSAKGLRVAAALDVTVRFPGARHGSSGRRPDPRFETVYRKAFVNYAQGTTFRLSSELDSKSAFASTVEAGLVSGPRYRIRVRQNGVVRLDYNRMLATGFLSEPLSSWKLTSRGVEAPLQVRDDGDDVMEPGDWVQFYGQALDDEPKTVLNDASQGIYEARDFSDENVYFLTAEAGSRSRMSTRTSAANAVAAAADFEAIAHYEMDNAWRPLGGADPWYFLSTLVSNGTSSRTDTISLPDLASGTAPARVLVKVRGITEDFDFNPDHHTLVTLMNSTNQILATNNDDGTFDGRTIYLHDFTWPGTGSPLSNPAKVKLELLPVAGLASHQVILDWMEIRYRRSFHASGDALTFDRPDGDARFDVTGLQTTSVEVYEITGRVGTSNVVAPVRVTGASITGSAGNVTASFRVNDDPALPPGTLRRFVVVGDQGGAIPADPDFSPDTVSDLRNTGNQADLIVIAHPAVLDQSPGGLPNQWLGHRASEGITSKIALIEDVQDEFNDGLPGPVAIRNFLRWVMSTAPGEGWADPKPAYVLLLGDGSFAYKLGTPNGNFVPTQTMFRDVLELGYYASDSILAAVVGDDPVPDLTIGRLSARTVSEANDMFQKILDYDQIAPPGTWRSNVLLVSDRGKGCSSNEALDFELLNDLAEGYMQRPSYTTRKLRYWTDYCADFCNPGQFPACGLPDATAIRQAIKDSINGVDGFADGAVMVQYSGHGNFEVWSDDAFWDNRLPGPDSDDLTNGAKLPWMINHNCLTGGFHFTNPASPALDHSLGEDWMKKPDGGAIAVYAPSGLSSTAVGDQTINPIWDDVFGPAKERSIAVPVLDAWVTLCQNGSLEACGNYVFLGDPTLKLGLPDVAPASSLAAVAGNARVDLSWSGSPTPGASYSVYRASTLQNPVYTKLKVCSNDTTRSCTQNSDCLTPGTCNATPLTATNLADLTAVNTTTYYYYVVAQDAGGFESRWSNFNSDCAVNGPDCVKATPSNPNPPAVPGGLAVADLETGGRLAVTWSANGESDLLRYNVSWGIDPVNPADPCPITDSRNVGKPAPPSFVISGLANGTRYCVVVTATNTSNKTSAPSGEATGVPTLVPGVKPPAFITDLKLGKSGANAVLTWGAVTTDIYGKTETVAFYEVYRGTTPNFTPSLANRIGTPTVPTYTDVGALSSGGPYHYLVRAVDTDGNVGGLGSQLPAGIGSLVIGKSGADLTLSWPAVATDFDGRGTRVTLYEVYASSQRFTRANIREGLVPLLQSVTVNSATITPPATNQFYSVLAVDSRGNKSPF